ncbi:MULTISPECIES: amidophosphoribosyltransferase [Mycolicibacter]|uniref:Amidophosphoribosyltransferase n=1 Tax=[Mycobacterium] vasticus TaxID=2875777 RepID=A0ABU5Z596_9MYCO|nr:MULTISPECIES: amidophosphoribosyltransferase [unclassified Mycolicibacter]MEB3065505.1 amidophosphoribosyltransferase [Mycolicibacter sp. MYC101]MEB3072045.1 amidophosphoribosyltransferase [Mycolicibacter sp. MYC017]
MTTPGEQQARLLVVAAGGYLHNIIREPQVTCATCATPVDGYTHCIKCQQDASTPGLADLVVPLTYVLARSQSGLMMRQYKDDPAPQVRSAQAQVISRLLYLGIVRHQRCVETVIGQPVNRRLAIPGSPNRIGTHPFITMATAMNAVEASPQLVPRTDIPISDRDVTPARFAVSPPSTRFDGQHVMLLDDTWTTGSRTQSAAILLRQHGATHVTVMTVARWIEPTWGSNPGFIRTRLTADFDPDRCPVTGTTCP